MKDWMKEPPKRKKRQTKVQYEACILVIDDNNINLDVAQGMFELYGCQVDTCTSGKDAIEIIKEKKYDLIVLDLQMPDMDGFQTADIMIPFLKSSQINTPIIALTANINNVDDLTKCTEHGMQDVLVKPLTTLMLETRLEAWNIRKIYHHMNEPKKEQSGLF